MAGHFAALNENHKVGGQYFKPFIISYVCYKGAYDAPLVTDELFL